MNVYGIDLLELLDQHCIVIGVQHLRESEDIVAAKGKTNVRWLEDHQCTPKLIEARLLGLHGEAEDDLGGLCTLLDARLAESHSF